MGRPQETPLPARPPGYWQERNSRLLQELWHELALSHQPFGPWDDMGPNPCVEDILEVLHHSGAKWRDFWAVFPYHFREQLHVLDDASVEALGVLLHSDAAKQRFQLFFDPANTLATTPAAAADGTAQQQAGVSGSAEGHHARRTQQQAGAAGAAAPAGPAPPWPLPLPPGLAGPVLQSQAPRLLLRGPRPPARAPVPAAEGAAAGAEGTGGRSAGQQRVVTYSPTFTFAEPAGNQFWLAPAPPAAAPAPWGPPSPPHTEHLFWREPTHRSAAARGEAEGAEAEALRAVSEAIRTDAEAMRLEEADTLVITLRRAREAAARAGAAVQAAYGSDERRSQRATQQQQQQQRPRMTEHMDWGMDGIAFLQEVLEAAPTDEYRSQMIAGLASSFGTDLGGIGPSPQDRVRAIGRARREVPLEQQPLVPEGEALPGSPSGLQQLTGRARRYSMMVALAPGAAGGRGGSSSSGSGVAAGQSSSHRLQNGYSRVVATARATLQAPQRHVRPRLEVAGAGAAAGCSSPAGAAGVRAAAGAPGSSPGGGSSSTAAANPGNSSTISSQGGRGAATSQQPFRAVHAHLTREDEELVTLIQELVPYDLSLVPQPAVQSCLQELCGPPGTVPQQLVLEVGRLIEATSAAVTLLVAGAGRTRSALAAAVALAAAPARRPLYVDLRGLFHAADVDAAVLQGLFAAEEACRREDQLIGHLKLLGLSTRTPLLLLLDQADLLLRHDGGRYATELVAQLLHLLPRAQLLITAAAEDAEGVLEDLAVVVVEEARWVLPGAQGELHVQCYSKG